MGLLNLSCPSSVDEEMLTTRSHALLNRLWLFYVCESKTGQIGPTTNRYKQNSIWKITLLFFFKSSWKYTQNGTMCLKKKVFFFLLVLLVEKRRKNRKREKLHVDQGILVKIHSPPFWFLLTGPSDSVKPMLMNMLILQNNHPSFLSNVFLLKTMVSRMRIC